VQQIEQPVVEPPSLDRERQIWQEREAGGFERAEARQYLLFGRKEVRPAFKQ
jgi:hypothetical protein